MTLTPEQKCAITFSNIDTSDCGVVALMAVTGWDREEAERQATDVGRYKPGKGTPRGGLELVLEAHGIEHRTHHVEGETVATFSLKHEYGNWLVYVDGHVMALIGGDLYNDRGQWSKPVDRVTEVLR